MADPYRLGFPFDAVDFQTALEQFEIEDRTYESFPVPQEEYRLEVPALLDSLLAEARGVQCNPNDYSFCTYALRSVLLFCLIEAKRRLSTPTLVSGTTHVLEAYRYVRCSINIHKEQRTASGMANYTFGPAEEGLTGIDMLVVESAKVGGVGLLDHLVVTLLGAVHRAKVSEDKDLVSVFGITTDSSNFRFWNINENGQLHQSRLYEWHKGDGPTVISQIVRSFHFSMTHQALETHEESIEKHEPASNLEEIDPENSPVGKKRKREAMGNSLYGAGAKENIPAPQGAQ